MSRELDVKVAEAMGHFVDSVGWDADFLYATDEETFRRYVEEGHTGWELSLDDYIFCLDLPQYSTKIAVAWQVVEKLEKGPFTLHLSAGECTADFEGYQGARAVAPTAPEAICLAFLAATVSSSP